MTSRKQIYGSGGFTLLEALVALAIVTVALVAVLTTVSKGADVTNDLVDRTYGSWVAESQIASVRIDKKFIQKGITTGESSMGRRAYEWEKEIEAEAHPLFLKATVTVKLHDGRTVSRIGYYALPDSQ